MGKRLDKVLNEMGAAVTDAARRNLGTRTIGKNKSFGATKSRKLANSLTFSIDGTNMTFGSPLPYAKFIHWGVSGTHKKRKGTPFAYTDKQPPMDGILKWIKMKPLRLRDKDGKFIKQTESRLRSAAFMIARGIKRNGIPGLEYFTEAWETQYPKWKDRIADAIGGDTLSDLLDNLTNDNIKPE